MNDLLLIKPSNEFKDSIWEYRQEYFDFGETNINGSGGLMRYQDFDEWLEVMLSIEKDKLSKHNVHASTFFSIRSLDNKIIGSIQIRHSLTPELKQHGGQIGFGIRPTERKKGYGKKQLLLGLNAAKQMGIPEVLIICNKDNIASSKTIISCGGKLTRENVFNDTPQQIFWIS